MRIASQAVIDSARGAPCSARFPGICNHDPATTVWCHLSGGRFGKGMGMKAHDVLGFAGCSACHEYYDRGHATHPILTTDELLEGVLGAVCESYVRMIVSGIIIVPQSEQRSAQSRPVKARKPKAERARVPSNPDRKIPSRPMRSKGRPA
jgi:hypothetical protein